MFESDLIDYDVVIRSSMFVLTFSCIVDITDHTVVNIGQYIYIYDFKYDTITTTHIN